ncbi:MAG: alpha/beta hydrolase [Alphaproteobacteria bacterium]|nr:alpha/beta hydrolase [Alphaproteobacteria bacterium]
MSLYRGYDRPQLDDQYNNSKRVPAAPEIMARFQSWSAEVMRRPGVRLDLAYGPAAGERLDVFPADRPRAPIMIFFHGGYWQMRDKADFNFVADGFRGKGAVVVSANYTLCPEVTMTELARQCRAAVAWTWRHAEEIGGDRARIFVCGHSAGGHVTALLASTEWPRFASDLPVDTLKGGLAISGLYELEPIRLTYLNDRLRMDAAEAAAQSPMNLVPRRAPRLMLAVGGIESAEFLRQQADYAAAWRKAGLEVEEIPMPGHDHFSIIGALGDPTSALARAAHRLMGL